MEATATAPQTPSDVLRIARAKIDTPDKWWGGAGMSLGQEKNHCARTAISSEEKCLETRPEVQRALELFCQVLGTDPNRPGQVYRWNDAPERTHAEVLAAFDRAIALAEQEESHAVAS